MLFREKEAQVAELNLMMTGNPRNQPKKLQGYFGYDYLYSFYVRVELATLAVMHELGVVPEEDYSLLTPDVVDALMAIPTTEVDAYERAITKHDIRALVELMKIKMPPQLARWAHVPLTSYDDIDTGRAVMYVEAYRNVMRPGIRQAIASLSEVVHAQAEQVQIGRTHGQHALPVTVGFWLATILDRWMYNYQQLENCVDQLVGKISGAVGASNAIVGLGVAELCYGGMSFEERVLDKLGLSAAPISTQILPPEPLAYFLFATTMMSGSIAQFGRDCRHLMRTEIGEVAEPFSAKQTGSSTMAHKRNPVTFESLDGCYEKKQVPEFIKVLMCVVSEHQRDLTGSSPQRDFPVILVNLMVQLDALCRTGDDDPRPFIERMRFFPEAMERNLRMQANVILAEPLYIALQMAGYTGDAHELVNHTLVPQAIKDGTDIVTVLGQVAAQRAADDPALLVAWGQVPEETRRLLRHPESYIGNAVEKTINTVVRARELLLHA